MARRLLDGGALYPLGQDPGNRVIQRRQGRCIFQRSRGAARQGADERGEALGPLLFALFVLTSRHARRIGCGQDGAETRVSRQLERVRIVVSRRPGDLRSAGDRHARLACRDRDVLGSHVVIAGLGDEPSPLRNRQILGEGGGKRERDNPGGRYGRLDSEAEPDVDRRRDRLQQAQVDGLVVVVEFGRVGLEDCAQHRSDVEVRQHVRGAAHVLDHVCSNLCERLRDE